MRWKPGATESDGWGDGGTVVETQTVAEAATGVVSSTGGMLPAYAALLDLVGTRACRSLLKTGGTDGDDYSTSFETVEIFFDAGKITASCQGDS